MASMDYSNREWMERCKGSITFIISESDASIAAARNILSKEQNMVIEQEEWIDRKCRYQMKRIRESDYLTFYGLARMKEEGKDDNLKNFVKYCLLRKRNEDHLLPIKMGLHKPIYFFAFSYVEFMEEWDKIFNFSFFDTSKTMYEKLSITGEALTEEEQHKLVIYVLHTNLDIGYWHLEQREGAVADVYMVVVFEVSPEKVSKIEKMSSVRMDRAVKEKKIEDIIAKIPKKCTIFWP